MRGSPATSAFAILRELLCRGHACTNSVKFQGCCAKPHRGEGIELTLSVSSPGGEMSYVMGWRAGRAMVPAAFVLRRLRQKLNWAQGDIFGSEKTLNGVMATRLT